MALCWVRVQGEVGGMRGEPLAIAARHSLLALVAGLPSPGLPPAEGRHLDAVLLAICHLTQTALGPLRQVLPPVPGGCLLLNDHVGTSWYRHLHAHDPQRRWVSLTAHTGLVRRTVRPQAPNLIGPHFKMRQADGIHSKKVDINGQDEELLATLRMVVKLCRFQPDMLRI